MVKVTLEFPNTDAAIVALGRLAGAQAKDAGPKAITPVAPAAPATKPNKGRGRPRKEGKGGTAGAPSSAPAPGGAPAGGTAAEMTAAVPSAPSVNLFNDPATAAQGASSGDTGTAAPLPPGEPSSPPPSISDNAIHDALQAVFNMDAKGPDTALKLVESFGVTRAREIPQDKRAEFIEQANAIAKGK